ncbi:hypothetical protein FVEG_16163 [Fusarium verticillioides 7600]|uniref:Uncharacterized protein n=1 Tax=Gibberella moniliformis (strain M3125 / FGSC 7600) TaxID=334819 RepID=W7M9E4_GIBM7|nr:hypothetical protein FVEG_16163 [Fusarium verticillioides 7600]EWG47611.1 hypothetical protein FVEG_16163 [Fusarium verticillioides 7600]
MDAIAADIWEPFEQSVLDEWVALKDPATGKRLKTRPHWAKPPRSGMSICLMVTCGSRGLM